MPDDLLLKTLMLGILKENDDMQVLQGHSLIHREVVSTRYTRCYKCDRRLETNGTDTLLTPTILVDDWTTRTREAQIVTDKVIKHGRAVSNLHVCIVPF